MRLQPLERTVLDTAATGAVHDVPGGVDREAWCRVGEVSRDPVAVAAEAGLGVEEGRVEEVVGVEDPIPVRHAAFPAAGMELLLVEVHHEAMVGVEYALGICQ